MFLFKGHQKKISVWVYLPRHMLPTDPVYLSQSAPTCLYLYLQRMSLQ